MGVGVVPVVPPMLVSGPVVPIVPAAGPVVPPLSDPGALPVVPEPFSEPSVPSIVEPGIVEPGIVEPGMVEVPGDMVPVPADPVRGVRAVVPVRLDEEPRVLAPGPVDGVMGLDAEGEPVVPVLPDPVEPVPVDPPVWAIVAAGISAASAAVTSSLRMTIPFEMYLQ